MAGRRGYTTRLNGFKMYKITTSDKWFCLIPLELMSKIKPWYKLPCLWYIVISIENAIIASSADYYCNNDGLYCNICYIIIIEKCILYFYLLIIKYSICIMYISSIFIVRLLPLDVNKIIKLRGHGCVRRQVCKPIVTYYECGGYISRHDIRTSYYLCTYYIHRALLCVQLSARVLQFLSNKSCFPGGGVLCTIATSFSNIYSIWPRGIRCKKVQVLLYTP